jgi:membrane protease YdiL (CAAX protease family)
MTDAAQLPLLDQPRQPVSRGKLVGWVVLVSVLVALQYAARLSSGGDTDSDVLYQWATAVGGAITYAILAGIVLLIARGLDRRTLGLVRPRSWGRALALGAGALAAIWVIGGVLNIFLKAGEEQGLVPDAWDSSRAAPFVANFVVVAVMAPVVEELTYRGLGFATVGSVLGPVATIVVTGVAFGLSHGLFVALPVLSLFGMILGFLRWKTDSLYPPMLLHGVFNGAALLAAVTLGGGV